MPFKATFECDIDTLESSRDTLERELTCARKDIKETSRSNVALRSVLSKEKSTMKILKSYQEKQTFRTASATLRGQKNAVNLINIKGKPKDSKTFISLVKNNIQNAITQFGRQMKLAFLESNNHKMTVQKP